MPQRWRDFLKEESTKDTNKVAKVVIYNEENQVLFIKRTKYVARHAGEWDLPGGHAQENEDIEKAVRRETREETNLSLSDLEKIEIQKKTTYFKAKYTGGKIKLSKEHSEFLFRDVEKIENPDKYEKMAQKVVKKLKK
mgnify:CR=1 FL=1